MKDNQETAKRSDLINLAYRMVSKYSGEGEHEFYCPICLFSDGLFKKHICILCFNRSDDMETFLGCTTMHTFSLPCRVEYWEEVVKYLESLKSEKVFLGQLRYKCNQIDKQLGS